MISFLDISDLDRPLLESIINLEKKDKILDNKCIGLIFEKYSTRTRLSFNVGINQLGGNPVDLKFEELNISRDETFEDTFKAINCYLDGLIYRTTNHENLINAKNFFHKPIINALSDKSHPCQILSDLLTLKSHFGNFDLNILWIGDINNVCYSLIEAANLIEELGLFICSPREIIDNFKSTTNNNIVITDNLKEIDLSVIQCVMTDVFISMNDSNDLDKIKMLKPYSVDTDLMNKTSKNSIFMHCLPAKVGFEVSEEVFRSHKSIVWKQAYNRMVAQKKLLQFIYQ